jgi:hypothetical protein
MTHNTTHYTVYSYTSFYKLHQLIQQGEAVRFIVISILLLVSNVILHTQLYWSLFLLPEFVMKQIMLLSTDALFPTHSLNNEMIFLVITLALSFKRDSI